MTADAVTACMGIDSQGGINDFSKCSDLKSVVCQFDNILIGRPLRGPLLTLPLGASFDPRGEFCHLGV
jgi:hypothetical protein